MHSRSNLKKIITYEFKNFVSNKEKERPKLILHRFGIKQLKYLSNWWIQSEIQTKIKRFNSFEKKSTNDEMGSKKIKNPQTFINKQIKQQ